MQNTPEQGVGLAGVEMRAEGWENRTAKFDLSMTVWEEGGVVVGGVQYSTDLFEETVAQMLGVRRMLKAVVSEPERELAKVAILSDEEAHQLLVEWNDTRDE